MYFMYLFLYLCILCIYMSRIYACIYLCILYIYVFYGFMCHVHICVSSVYLYLPDLGRAQGVLHALNA